jgi:hypothetical protein
MHFKTLVTSIIDRAGTLDDLRREIIVENIRLVFCEKRRDKR